MSLIGLLRTAFSRPLSVACIGMFACVAFDANAVVFQAEDYDAYYDTTPGNSGGTYRSDDVDIEPTTDVGGSYNVGWIVAGEWLVYNNLTIPTTGSYTIRMRVASPVGAAASVDLNAGSIVLGYFDIPNTGDWQSWTTVSRTVTIQAGTYNLGVYAQTGDWNFNWIEVVPSSGSADELVWADEFDSIDPNNWTFETGGHGWGNNELQYYTAGQNAFVQYDAAAGSNVLVIEARQGNPGNFNCWYGSCTHTSTRMITRDKRSFQYGRVEARIKLPHTQGIWPAFWMLGNSFGQVGWPQSGEIDIMEHVGFEPTLTHGAIHGPGYSGNTPFAGTHDLNEAANANYHVYAMEWDANGIRWFVDGRQFYSVTRAQVTARGPWVFDQPFWLLLNVAVGGNWPGYPDATSSFPQRMYVDYVRVYR